MTRILEQHHYKVRGYVGLGDEFPPKSSNGQAVTETSRRVEIFDTS